MRSETLVVNSSLGKMIFQSSILPSCSCRSRLHFVFVGQKLDKTANKFKPVGTNGDDFVTFDWKSVSCF